jgi:hypothetical protein
MADVVLVHGIAQEQHAADTLEAVWLPALAGGVRTAHEPALADRLWRATGGRADQPPLDVRMAFYGDLFLDADAQGLSAAPITDLDNLKPAQLTLVDQLAHAWLVHAALYADDPADRALAQNTLGVEEGFVDDAQSRQVVRPAMNTLARLRWFAAAGMALGSLAWPALRQVSRYLTDERVRQDAQQRVLDHIGANTRLVIAHSLGTVVAYEALHRCTQPVALITLGAPLGLRNVVYERLRPFPGRTPACLISWDNFVDRDDLIAAHTDLTDYFPALAGRTVTPKNGPQLDNGARPHDVRHYLVKGSVGRAVAAALTGLNGEVVL